jgi:ribosomal-protein-alanine N-acetyltransferase
VGGRRGPRAPRDDVGIVSARPAVTTGVAAGDIAIRVATHDDVPAIVALEQVSFNNPWSAESFVAFLSRDTARILVAVRGAEVVGYAIVAWVLDEAELANIAVAPAERGRGVGARLLDEGLAQLASLGVRAVFLEVRGENAVAQRLYGSRGFAPVGRRRAYYDNPVDDAVLMRRGAAMD